MHICFASLDYPGRTSGGGVGNYVKTLTHELVKRGYRISVIALKKGRILPDESTDDGVNIYWITPGNVHWYVSKLPFVGKVLALPIREIEYSNAVLKAIQSADQKEPIDIVEGIETGAFGFKRLRPGIKTVIRLHGERYTFAKFTPPGHIPIDIRLSRYFQRKAFLNSNRLTAPSEVHAQEIRLELKGKGPTIRVIPNPVQVFSIERAAEKSTAQPIFLYIGRLQITKGILDLLKVIPLIREKVPNASFIIVGREHPSVSKKKIGSFVDELGIENAIRFLGHVDSGDLTSLYLKAKAVVLPSYYESFGYVPLEAVMHKVPVVAYNAGAVKNIIKNGENGFLVPPGDISALADACIKAVNIEVKAPDMDEINKYSVERVYQETISVYEDLLRNN